VFIGLNIKVGMPLAVCPSLTGFKSDYLPGSTEMRLCAGTIPENYGVMRYIIGIF
jgi:hypothetical protein